MTTFGFKAPCNHLDSHIDIAFGKYRLTFNLPGSSDDTSFTLDLQDADWTGNYDSPYDITIRWDIENRKLEYRIGTGNPYYDLDYDTIWDILDEAPPNQEAFQPTKPLGFRCTNANQIGEHPHFAWDGTSWPNGIRGEREITVYYKIYRNGIWISPEITALEWTDNSVTIGESGKIFRYHATAKLSHSPESGKSNIVYLTISLAKQKNNNQFRKEERKNTSHEFDISDIVCYPNPLNPITNISYFLPDEGYIYLAIYLFGRLTTTSKKGCNMV